jgi:hypothetical protein
MSQVYRLHSMWGGRDCNRHASNGVDRPRGSVASEAGTSAAVGSQVRHREVEAHRRPWDPRRSRFGRRERAEEDLASGASRQLPAPEITGDHEFISPIRILADEHVQQRPVHEGGRFPHENLGGDTCALVTDSEEDLPVFSPLADDSRRRLRSRRHSTGSGERTQNRAFWGGGLGRRRASWAASASLAQLCAMPPGRGWLGPSPPTHTTPSEQPSEDDMHVAKRVLVNGNWSDA